MFVRGLSVIYSCLWEDFDVNGGGFFNVFEGSVVLLAHERQVGLWRGVPDLGILLLMPEVPEIPEEGYIVPSGVREVFDIVV